MKRILTATALAVVMAATPALASTPAPAVAGNTSVHQQVAQASQIAEQGFYGVRNIQLSRLALFQGQPENAIKLVDEAAKLLADDSTDWKKFVKQGKKASLKNDQYVVINASLNVSENYIATPEKQAAIKSANEKFDKGDKKGALEALHLADIGVVENFYLLPLKQTQKLVADAQKLLAEKKYYEANLVLKSAEDSVIVDSSAVIAD